MKKTFIPALYDIKAKFCNKKLNEFASNEINLQDDILNALAVEIDQIELKVVTCAYDIYNMEAEVLGAFINRENAEIMPEVIAPIINDISEIDSLPDSLPKGGRIDAMINTAVAAVKKWPKIWIRGGVTGPFTLASILYGRDKILLDMILNPEGIKQLLLKTTQYSIDHALRYSKKNITPVIFDSFIAPPLIGPELYENIVADSHKKLFQAIKKSYSGESVLIAGGNTSELFPGLSKIGTSMLLLDYIIDINTIKEILGNYPDINFRINLNPALFSGNKDALLKEVHNFHKNYSKFANAIPGSGILDCNASIETIQKVAKLFNNKF